MAKSQSQETTISKEIVLNPQVAQLLKKSGLSEQDKTTLIRAVSMSFSHSGPLPDKDTITIYNREIPNGGDRLMSQVEKQFEHRGKLETNAQLRSFNQSSTGQWLGFAIAGIFGLISWDLIKSGHEVGGTIIGSFDLVALVAVFITGNRSK